MTAMSAVSLQEAKSALIRDRVLDAVAVLLDATVVRGVLLPAVLALLGDRAHQGPAWLPRLHH